MRYILLILLIISVTITPASADKTNVLLGQGYFQTTHQAIQEAKESIYVAIYLINVEPTPTNNPLRNTAEQYHRKSHVFLENTFYKKEAVKPELVYDFETVAWYYTLLPVKLHRALCGFHEPVCEDEFALYDAVAQFQICKKAIKESIRALRTINQHFPSRHIQILELLALLNNIHSRIEAMEGSI